MAETTKEQAKNSQVRSKNTEQTLQSEKGITAEHEKQSKFTEQEIAAGIDFSDILNEQIKNLDKKREAAQKIRDDIENYELAAAEVRRRYFGQNKALGEQIIQEFAHRAIAKKEELDVSEKVIESDKKRQKLIEATEFTIRRQGDIAKGLGDKIEGFFDSVGGESLVESLGIKNFGNKLQQEVLTNLTTVDEKTGELGSAFGAVNKQVGGLAKRLMALVIANPFFALAAAAIAVVTVIRRIGKASRDLANDLSLSKDQLDGQLVNLKLQEARFKVLNLDASQLKGTLTTLSEEFRDLSLVTAENAANIEKFAQNSGIAGTEVAKLNKKLMVMEGLSFDAALSMQQQAASMSKAEGLAVGRVLSDMATAAEDFARFSRDGADGLAEAAVAAAKLGLSLDGVLKASEGLLDFESSITKEFEAQVLTGQALNLERARQAALAGDQEGLLQEIRSIAQGVNVESMNVVQKDAIAGAIGISVADLMRVSRGESLDKQQTQIDLQKETNDILLNGFQDNTDELKNIEENTKQGGATANNLTGVQFEVST